ncbi:MAG TPA: hypothetical protein VH417_10690 [Vicinamibacterales bacterium]
MVSLLLSAVILAASFAPQTMVPFELCAESVVWTRPSPEVQAKIWNDPRYAGVGETAYEWTHDFVLNGLDSASLTYHSQNLSGLWTDPQGNRCLNRDSEHDRWTEIWALNYHVVRIDLNGPTYTITVTRRGRGYEIIQFRRPDSLGAATATLRFVDDGGKVLAEWVETALSAFKPLP